MAEIDFMSVLHKSTQRDYLARVNEPDFPKAKADDSDKLEDSVDQGTLTDNTVMGRYVQGISQAAKFDKVKN